MLDDHPICPIIDQLGKAKCEPIASCRCPTRPGSVQCFYRDQPYEDSCAEVTSSTYS